MNKMTTIKKLEVGNDSFFYQNKTHKLLNWQDTIRELAMAFYNNKLVKQTFVLTVQNDINRKEVIFGGIKYIKSDFTENINKFDNNFIRVKNSDIGLPFLVDGWKYWFKHICSNIIHSNKKIKNYEVYMEKSSDGSIHVSNVIQL